MKKSGLTLIEMVVVIIVVGIINAVLAGVITSGMDAWVFMRGQKKFGLETMSALKRMVREIRRTKDSSSLLNFTSTRCRFKDIDNNIIDYQKNGVRLERNGVVLLDKLETGSGLQLSYLDKSGADTTTTTEVSVIQITLVSQDSSNRIRLKGCARIRNQ